MTKTDLAEVTKIESDCQSHPWSLLQFLDSFHAGHKGWLAYKTFQNGTAQNKKNNVEAIELNNELIVGFAVISSVLDEGTLLNICIRPAFQKQGYGRSLLDFLLHKAKLDKIEKMFLEVRASNQSAITLYESLGFEKISERKDYYPAIVGREDGLVYLHTFLQGP